MIFQKNIEIVYPEIQIIQQINPWTCYPACLSILLGMDLKETIGKLGHDGSKKNGFDNKEIKKFLNNNGWKIRSILFFTSSLQKLCDKLKKKRTKYRYIFGIDLKKDDTLHAVCWDGISDKIIDPFIGKEKEINKQKVYIAQKLIPKRIMN